jgi:putative tricarboxylic transport membrane protein
MRRLLTLLLSGVLLLAGCAAGDQPARLRIMVPNVAGGGYDVTARTAAAIAQRAGVVDQPVAVFMWTVTAGRWRCAGCSRNAATVSWP